MLLLLAAAATPLWSADFFAAPDGKPTGTGTMQAPWDLVTAIRQSAVIRPGDTLNLRGGTYVTPNRTAIYMTLNGAAGKHITVRPWSSEHVTIDGGFYVQGSWLIVRDLEIASSFTNRTTSYSGSFPIDIVTPTGIDVTGTNVKIINNVVHDMSTGVASWRQAADNEFYGNLVYYNGWKGPDRPHGHGAYMQNTSTRKLLHDNIFFSGFELGLQLYGSASTFLNNFELEGNIIFKSGELGGRSSRNILIGGDVVAANPVLRDNYTYFPTSETINGENNVGYWPGGAGCSNLIAENNYMVGGTSSLVLQKCTVSSMKGNTFFGDTKNWTPSSYPGNTVLGRVRPAGYKAFVRPNRYESGRAHIAIFNWSRQATVPVDLSGIGLVEGDSFEIRDAQNFYGPNVWQGVYSGSPIDVPMTSTAVAQPVGNAPYKPTHSDMEFGAFIVLRLNGNTPPPPPSALVITAPAVSGVTASGATLTWTTSAPADTALEYGTAATLGLNAPVIPALSTTHSVTLSGLTANTTYYTRLVSTDAAGQTAENRTVAFTTSAPPPPALTITAATVSAISTSGATLTWTTSAPANTAAEYGTTTALGLKTAVNAALSTVHSATLTGLTANTTYYTRLVSTDAASQTAENRTLTFTTSAAPPPTLTITGATVSAISTSGATLTWTTSTPASTAAEYGTTTALGLNTGTNTALTIVHSATLTGLAANTAYYTRLVSTDAAGQTTENRTLTFRTAAPPPSTPPPDPGPGTGTPLYTVWYEAEKGARSNFTLLDSPIVSGGKYVASTQANRGYVTFDVYVPNSGNYIIWSRVLAPSATTSNFHVQLDAQAPILFDGSNGGTYSPVWRWSRLNSGTSPRLVTVTAGWHKLYVLSKDAPFAIDGFLITSDAALTPTDAAFTTLR